MSSYRVFTVALAPGMHLPVLGPMRRNEHIFEVSGLGMLSCKSCHPRLAGMGILQPPGKLSTTSNLACQSISV